MARSATSDLAGVLFGPCAAAVVSVLEHLGVERHRSFCGGFVTDVLNCTSMFPSDVNSAISTLLKAGLIRRRGTAIIEVVVITESQIRALCGP